jgi:translation initiation factor 2 beta subunit (eIF-2beta)/eIF-5
MALGGGVGIKEGEDYLYGRVVGKNYTYTNNKIPNFSLKIGIFKEGKSPNNHYAYLSVPNNVDASILTNLLNKSGSINNSNNSYSNQFSRYDLSEDEVKTIINHFTKISKTKKMGHGGLAESENKEMVLNNNKQIAHHTKEMSAAVRNSKYVPAWVVAKVNRSATDLSDATHYMEGEGKSYAIGGGVEYKMKMVSFPEDKTYKYYVVNEDTDNYLTVQTDMFDKWKNANQRERAEYYSEWIPKSEMIEVMATGGGVDDSVNLLREKIRNASSNMYEGAKSNVVYFGSNDKLKLDNYTDLIPYSAQGYTDEVQISFNSPNKTMITFSNKVLERFEDRKSFEKYGGIIYIYEPLTKKIASNILKKVDLLKKYATGGNTGGTSDSAEMNAPTLGGTMTSSMAKGGAVGPQIAEIKAKIEKAKKNTIMPANLKKQYIEKYQKQLAALEPKKEVAKKAAPKKAVVKKAAAKKVAPKKSTKAVEPTGGRTERGLIQDKERLAKKAGKRISESGGVYYENRENRSDKNRKTRLEDGGTIKGWKHRRK